MEKEVLVSVIIPAYNAEKTVEKCIESIQMYNSGLAEIIVVNDGSNDNTRNIVENIKKTDLSVILINQNNEGVSSARNKGIDIARGKFILFVDADDYMISDAFYWIKNNVDEQFMMFSVISDASFTTKRMSDSEIIQSEMVYPLKGDFNNYRINAPWSKVYRTDIIKKNNIRFDTNLKIGEDTCFIFEYLNYVGNVLLINTPIYFYDTSSESVTRRFNNDLLNIDICYQKKIDTLCKSVNKNMEANLTLSLLNGMWRCISDYFMNVNNKKRYHETLKEYRKFKQLCTYFRNVTLYKTEIHRHFNIVQRLFFLLAKETIYDRATVSLFFVGKQIRRWRCKK